MQGQRSNSVPAQHGQVDLAHSALPAEHYPLSRLVAGPSRRRPPPSPTTGPRFRTAIHYRSYADQELKRKLHDSHLRLVDTFEAIGQKYGSVPLEEDDEVDIFTGQITRDRGRLKSLEARPFAEGLDYFGEAVEDEGEPPRRWQSEPVTGPESVIFGDDEDELGDWDERSGLDPQMPPREIEQPWTTEDLDDLNSFLRAEAASRERSASRGIDNDDLEARGQPSSRGHLSSSSRLEDLFLDDSEEDEHQLDAESHSEWEDVSFSASRSPRHPSRHLLEGPSSRSLSSSHSLPDIRSALRPPTNRFPADRYTSQPGSSRRRLSTGPRVRWSDDQSVSAIHRSPLSERARGKQRMLGERPGDYTVRDSSFSVTTQRGGIYDGYDDNIWDARSIRRHPTPSPTAMRILSEQAWWQRRSESPAVWDAPVSPQSYARQTYVQRSGRYYAAESFEYVRRPRGRPRKGSQAPRRFANSKTSLGCRSCLTAGGDRALRATTCRGNNPQVYCPYDLGGAEFFPESAVSTSSADAAELVRPLRPSTAVKAQVSASRQMEIEERRTQRRRPTVVARPTAPRLSARMKREQTAAAQPTPPTKRPAALSDHFYALHVLAKGGVVKCHACKAAGGTRADWAGYCRGRSRPKLCAFLETEFVEEENVPSGPAESPLPEAEESIDAPMDMPDDGWAAMDEPQSPGGNSPALSRSASPIFENGMEAPFSDNSEDEQEVQMALSSDGDSGDEAYRLSDAEVADDSEWEDVAHDDRQIILEHLPGTTANYSLPPKGDAYHDMLLYNGKHDFVRCASCVSARGTRAEQAVWCKGRADDMPCPLGSTLALDSRRAAAKPGKTDSWIEAQGDLFAPPSIPSEAMSVDSAPESSQPSSPVISTVAEPQPVGLMTRPRASSDISTDSSLQSTALHIVPVPRATTALPTPPRSKSISTDIEQSSSLGKERLIAPYPAPSPSHSQTSETSSMGSTAKKRIQYWTVRTPAQIPSSDMTVPSSASATSASDSDVRSSEPPEPFPDDLVTRASDLGIHLGPAPSGRISTGLLTALSLSPRRVEPLAASISHNGFSLASPPPRSPATLPMRSKTTATGTLSEPTRRAATATSGLMLPPPIPATPRKRLVRDPDDDDDMPTPSPQKRRSTPSTAPRPPVHTARASTPLSARPKDETELELERVAAEMGDDAGLEWGLDEDAGDIAREFREGSVVVYA